jgi:galactitol-specific phosphotransferase system IIB component
MTRKVVTACGLAVSMAQLVAGKVNDRLAAEGITDVEVIPAKVPELENVAKDAVCVITTVKIWDDLGVPIIDATDFVMGGDGKAALDQMVELLNA